jgi:hypothetical protein
MRAKLLRAIAHLKSAALHLEEARDLLSDYRVQGDTADIKATLERLFLARTSVKKQYADQVERYEPAAELPR